MAWGWIKATGRGLKKAGLITLKGAKVGAAVGVAVLETGTPVLNTRTLWRAVSRGIDTAENEFRGAKGQGKLKRALAERIARNILQSAEAAAGRDLYDEDKWARVIGYLIEAWIEFRNARKGKP